MTELDSRRVVLENVRLIANLPDELLHSDWSIHARDDGEILAIKTNLEGGRGIVLAK